MIGIKFDHSIYKEDETDITREEMDILLSTFIELVESKNMLTGGTCKLIDLDNEEEVFK